MDQSAAMVVFQSQHEEARHAHKFELQSVK